MNTLKIVTISLLTLGSFLSIKGQEKLKKEVEYKNQFFMLPTNLIDKIVQFGYERKLSDENNNTVMVQLGAYINGSNVLEETKINGTGYKVELNYNAVFDNMTKNENNAANFYISPYLNYFNSTFKIGENHFNNSYATETISTDSTSYTILTNDSIVSDGKAKLSDFGAGVLIGLKWTIAKRVVFDFYFGGGYQRANYSGENKFRKPLSKQFVGNFVTTGILGRAGIRMGVKF